MAAARSFVYSRQARTVNEEEGGLLAVRRLLITCMRLYLALSKSKPHGFALLQSQVHRSGFNCPAVEQWIFPE